MKTKKFKKELSVAIAESIVNSNFYFSIELKKENLKVLEANFSSTLLVKVISKKLKLSDFLKASTFKFPMILKVFKNSDSIENYLSNQDEKKSPIVFAKFNFVSLKSTNLFLLSKLKAVNTFNTLDNLLNSGVLFLRLINASKKEA